GGASAAARARRLDEAAEIVLLERSPHLCVAADCLPRLLGGEGAPLAALPTPEAFRTMHRIDVRTRHEALAIDRAAREVQVLDHPETPPPRPPPPPPPSPSARRCPAPTARASSRSDRRPTSTRSGPRSTPEPAARWWWEEAPPASGRRRPSCAEAWRSSSRR